MNIFIDVAVYFLDVVILMKLRNIQLCDMWELMHKVFPSCINMTRRYVELTCSVVERTPC